MNRNTKITIGLSLVSVVAAAILLICKKNKCICSKDSDLAEKACSDIKMQEPKK